MYSSQNQNRRFRGVTSGTFARRDQSARSAGENPYSLPNDFADPNLVDYQKLTWQEGFNARGSYTYLRILPTRDETAPDQWAPTYIGQGEAGQWIRAYGYFHGGQRRQVSFLTHDASLYDPDDPEDRRALYDLPTFKLRDSIYRASESSHPQWYGLTHKKTDSEVAAQQQQQQQQPGPNGQGGRSRFPFTALPRTVTICLVRALCLQRGTGQFFDQPQGLGPDDKIPMFGLKPNAASALTTALELSNWEDVASIRATGYVCLHRNGDLPNLQGFNPSAGYGAQIIQGPRPDCPRLPASPDLSYFEQQLFEKLVPWSRVVKVLSPEEQVEKLARLFDQDILEYAWYDEPAWLNIVRGINHPATTVQMPHQGYAQAPAQPQQYGQHPQGGYPQQPQATGYPQQPHQAPAHQAAPPSGFGPQAAQPAAAAVDAFGRSVMQPAAPSGFGPPPAAPMPPAPAAPPTATAPAGFGPHVATAAQPPEAPQAPPASAPATIPANPAAGVDRNLAILASARALLNNTPKS